MLAEGSQSSLQHNVSTGNQLRYPGIASSRPEDILNASKEQSSMKQAPSPGGPTSIQRFNHPILLHPFALIVPTSLF